MVIETLGALDLYTIFINYIFGGFWMAILGLTLLIFIIMGVLGRMSIYTVTWYCAMFILSLTIGYGYITLNIFITIILIIALIFSIKGFLDRGGQ